ncbi:hypothetical protein [Vreelandella nanhaiensis]|uniref:Uncharacterized protein n=1 Tax=Vreelandella nanhaiensis TaxID=1258546 RepID=A0A433KYC8_9GAMM|nr:hypothetical protein [Halomonas nanhaiensis]RUR34510.1 hypothetical protein ELY38_02660 [Halomonas nanhaiensis]
MTQPTHTHRELGGKYAELQQHMGTGPLEGQWLVIYEDLDKGIQSGTTQADWLQNWRPLLIDDCPVCMGAGHDHIKGNRDRPCGSCYGLGKVRADGEAAAELWELATIATGIIQRQQEELLNLRRIANNPAVQALLDQERQQAIIESTARNEQAWRESAGYGPGGQRYTGD